MVHKREGSGWQGVDRQVYKDEPGTWEGVSRFTFSPTALTQFEMRFFEVEAGGYTSLEEHEHEHCVFIVSGRGEVWLEEKWQELAPGDFVQVKGWQTHQFKASPTESLGFVCVVDRVRDRPQVKSSCDLPATSFTEPPKTARKGGKKPTKPSGK